MNEKISNYFTKKESIVSSTGEQLGIINTVADNLHFQIKYTASRLDTIRYYLGLPMVVLSFYRNRKLNKAVGGAEGSQHTKGEAVDFTIRNTNLKEIFEKIKKSGLSYDQLIYYPNQNFIHISFKIDILKERKMAFTK